MAPQESGAAVGPQSFTFEQPVSARAPRPTQTRQPFGIAPPQRECGTVRRLRSPGNEPSTRGVGARTLRTAAIADHRGVGAREVGGPVRLPGASVIGEGLLPARVVGVEFGPGVPHHDRAAAVLVLSEELSPVTLEAADDRRAERPGAAADP